MDYVYGIGIEAAMGRLYQTGKMVIRVFSRDHLPPHFHVITPDGKALVEIATLRILAGSLPPRAEREALAWAAENKAAIAAEWNRVNPNLPYA